MNHWKLFRRAGLGILLLVVLVTAAILVIVRTDRFRNFVLAEIVRKTETTIGGRLTIAGMAVNWRLLEFDFYGITLHGSESSSQSPLFAANHLRVGLKITSILRREVNLREIVLEQPVAHLNVDSAGNSNLPQAPSRQHTSSSSNESKLNDILNMAIGHLQINSGQFYYNDEETPLSAELREFRAQIYFNRPASEYRGTLAYDDGRLTAADFAPIAHRLQMNFVVGRSGIVIDPIQVATGKSHLNARAQLSGYTDIHISGNYDGVVNTSEISNAIRDASIPTGDVALTGSLAYHDAAKGSWIENAYLDGTASSQQMSISLGRKVATAKSIRAEFRLQGGDLTVKNIEATALGGRITGNYDLLQITGKSSSRFQASVQSVSLEQLTDAAPTRNLPSVRLVGSVDGTVDATWAARIQDGTARVHLAVRNSSRAATASSAIPLSGLINLNYDGARNVAAFDHSYLKTGNTTITATGVLGNHSQLDTELNTSNLHELAALVSTFESGSRSRTDTILSDLHGSARFQGQVLGSVKDPRIKGALFANNLEVQKTRWNSLHVNLDAASTDVSIQNGSLEDTQKGQITFSARSSLQNWSFSPSSSISLQLQTKQIAVANLQQVANSHYPVSGLLSANIAIHGSQENPEGQGSIQISRASAWNQPINSLSVDFKGDGSSIHSTVKLASPNGSLNGELTYLPKAQSYEATLQSSDIKLDQLPAEQIRALNISGNASISASGHGTLSDPQLTANLNISQLRIRNQAFFDTQAQLNLANQRADFTLNAKADQGIIQATGNVVLSGEYPATASLDIRSIPIATVVASYLHTNPKLQGTAEVHANLKGPLKNPTAVVAQLEIPQLNLSYESTNLAVVRPLRITYQNQIATIEDGEVKGSGTDFSIKGTIPVKSAAPLNVSANGTVDLSIIQGFVPDVRSSGRIDLNVSARGDLSHPAMQGQIHIVNATASSEDIPVGLEGINGLLQISGNRIEIAQFSGAAGGGTVAARGFMTYGEPSNFNLGLDLKSVRLRYPQGVRSILSGNLALNGNEGSSELTGRVLIDRLSFTQQFDLANFLSQFSAEAPSTTPSPLERNMKLNVALNTAQDVNLANNKLSIAGAANLILSGTVADPVVLGRTTLTSGEIFFMGKRYEIQGGTIQFANPIQTMPILNLDVTTTVQQYNITLNFVGPPDRLKTNYTSDPPLPPADIINLIAFGKTSEQAATSASTPASVGAQSVLAQGAASQLSSKIESVTGITQLTIDPLAANSQSNTGSVVAIQQRVTGNILFTFSTDVTSTENQSVQLQYQIKKNLSISVLRDTYGGYAADVRIHKSF